MNGLQQSFFCFFDFRLSKCSAQKIKTSPTLARRSPSNPLKMIWRATRTLPSETLEVSDEQKSLPLKQTLKIVQAKKCKVFRCLAVISKGKLSTLQFLNELFCVSVCACVFVCVCLHVCVCICAWIKITIIHFQTKTPMRSAYTSAN